MQIAYISGPYSAPTPEGIEANVRAAAVVAAEVAALGYAVFCPHTNSYWVDGAKPGLSYAYWLAADLAILTKCDLMVMVRGWGSSDGAFSEWKQGRERMPVYYHPDRMPPALVGLEVVEKSWR